MRFQPPFFPQLKAFVQCANHATVLSSLGKSSKGVGEMFSIKEQVNMKKGIEFYSAHRLAQ